MVKIGIIGTGYWGKHHLRVFKNLNCKIVGVFDIDRSKKNLADEYGVEFFSRFDDILKKVDAVSIITPPASHFRLAKRALLAGKHVLVEKPFVLKSRQAKLLVKIASEKNLTLMVGHIYLYNQAIKYLKSEIENLALGKIYYLISERLNLGIIRTDVNALWNFAPHDLSIICHLLNDFPVSVSCFGKSFLQEGIEDVVFVNLNFAGGIIANISLSWLHPLKTRRLTVVGDKKMAVFDDTLDSGQLKIYDRGVDREKVNPDSSWKSYKEFKIKLRFGDEEVPRIVDEEPLLSEAQDFLDSVDYKKTPLSNADKVYKIVCILEAAQKSLKKGGKNVDIDY